MGTCFSFKFSGICDVFSVSFVELPYASALSVKRHNICQRVVHSHSPAASLPQTRYLEIKMIRLRHTFLTMGMLAAFATFAEVQAQIFYRSSGTSRYVPQYRGTLGTQNRVYTNNGVQQQSYQSYQSHRPSYDQTTVYSNGSYTVQPNGFYSQNNGFYGQSAPNYYAQPTTSYYHGSNGYPAYSGNNAYSSNYGNYDNQIYSNQSTPVYGNNYGSGYYNSPQQAGAANTGARIGNAIGGAQGAQIGAAIGSAIRP